MTLHAAKGLEFDTCSCPAGRKACCRISAHSTTKARGPGRRAAALAPCRPHARAPPRENLLRVEPAHPRKLVVGHSLALPRRTARGQCRGDRGEGWLRQFAASNSASRFDHDAELRFQLHDARLAARAGTQRRAAASTTRTSSRAGPRSLEEADTPVAPERRPARGPVKTPRPAHIEGELVAKSTGRSRPSGPATASFIKSSATQCDACRRQQAHHRVRQGRRKTRGRQLCRASLSPIFSGSFRKSQN